MRRKLLTLAVFLLVVIASPGQDIKQQVLSSAGGFSVSNDNAISLSWTLGELVISTVQSTDNQLILTQGFQQSMLNINSIIIHPELGVTVTVYPNPTSEMVNIRLASPLEGNTTIFIAGPDGREVLNDIFYPGELIKVVNLQEFPAGTYFMRIQNGNKLNVYKIIKL